MKKASLRFTVIPLSEVPATALPADQRKSPTTEIAADSGKPRYRSAMRLDKPAKRGNR
jgi:hypothetical protein